MQQEQTQELKIEEDTLTAAGANGQHEQEQHEKVELFLSSVKSKETREKYSIYLKKYMELQGLTEKDL